MNEQKKLEEALEDFPHGVYAVSVDYLGSVKYLFARVDEDGDVWSLGTASEAEDGGWVGRLDTKSVSFDDEDELRGILAKQAWSLDVVDLVEA